LVVDPAITLDLGHTLEARGTIASDDTVGAVLPIRGWSQVAPAVVVSDPVDVIDHARRIFPGHHLPSDPMRLEKASIEPNLYVALAVDATGRFTSEITVPSAFNPLGSWNRFPDEKPRLRIIDETSMQDIEWRQQCLPW
jgi:hypothetical protein